jgi:ribosome biogenesis protein BMS1
MPIILVRINLGEESLGFIKVNFRRHRWYTNLLKSNDPIIVSNGWRRYQTLITFVKSDLNERLRYLKYTPNYDYCLGVFYGNFNQQNTGCVFMQSINNEIKKFRIAGSGVILEINKSFDVFYL